MKRQIMFLCMTLCVVSHAMHLHPRHKGDFEDIELGHAKRIEKLTTDVDGIPVDVIRNIPPTRFVPINSMIFFKSYPPCDEGFERDFLGICREVWD